MATKFESAPTYADPVIIDELTEKARFNPIWLKWFLSVVQMFNDLVAQLQNGTVAIGLKTATTTVSVSAAGAPTAGQVLTASSSVLANWQTPGGGVPTAITVANEATDTTCFPAFFTAAAGDLGPKTNGALTFNSSTVTLGCTNFVGALTGTASGNLVSGGALGTPSSGVGTNLTGTAAGLTAGSVTTNANLTGHVTSSGNAAVLGSFTSLQLKTALTDETGSGAAVFANTPTLVTPVLGVATVTSLNGHTFTAGSSTFTGTAAQVYTFPTTTANLYGSVDAIPAANVPNGIITVRSALFTQSMVAGTYYYIPNSALTMPATSKTGGGMSTSTRMQWCFMMRKTAAGTAAFNIRIYRGTNGTTADTADVTQSIGVATAVVDIAKVIITLAVTVTGASGTYTWGIAVNHKAATATGFGTTDATPFFEGTVAGVALNTASLKFGVGLMGTTGTTALVLAGLTGNVDNMN